MPRIPAVATAAAAPKAQSLLEGVQKKLGITPNMMRTMANSPAVLDAYLAFSGSLGRSQLSAKLREQIALTVGELNHCLYCLAAHTALARSAGLSDEEIADSRRSTATDRKAEAVLRLARRIVEEHGRVSDDDLAAARGAGLGDAEIVEVVAVVALNLFTNYVNHVAGTEVDFPEVAPPPAQASLP